MATNGKIHPTDRMTSRQRLLAAYRGQDVDRLPYWAKVANPTWRRSQPQPVQVWSDRELLDYILADGLFGCVRFLRRVSPRAERTESRDGDLRTVVTHTPDGDLVERWGRDPLTASWHPVEFPVKTREDLGRYRWLFADVRIETDADALRRARAQVGQIGERGITKAAWGTSPLMHLVEHVIGPIHTTYMLADWPDEMDELVGRMHAANLAFVRRLAEETPADLVVSVENTSTTLISPGQFERYSLGHLTDYGRAIRQAGRMHELHMCGKLLALLGRIDTIPAASIEAFTSPTLGDTRLVDGRTKAPSKTLVGGTRVNTWLAPVEDIKAYILGELEACPDHRRIVLTTAGVAPPACPAETFRAIGQWIPTVPVRMQAGTGSALTAATPKTNG
jgi:uroporphyrinogen-III decarboxylase